MVKRYTINSEFVFEDCLVTPGVYEKVASDKTSRNNEPNDLHEYARVIKQTYRIEEGFHRAKGECVLGDYQVRNRVGWHHHVALRLWTLWFLTMELMNQKKRIDDDDSTSA